MRNDHNLQKTVMEQLDCDPSVNSSHIGVAAQDGIVVLSGHVASLSEKRAAEKAAGEVHGVKAVIDKISVELAGQCPVSDETLAAQAHARLASNRDVPLDRIHVAVEEGVVTLWGDVDWYYQLEAIQADLHKLDCIREIRSKIEIKPPAKVEAVRRKVHDALDRIAPLDANKITVEANGSQVLLTGLVNSWHERNTAESVARSVPGVTHVTNQITVV